jgi:hypothetical protein
MIITDYWMPEMTGYELLKKVKVCARIVRLHSAAASVVDRTNLFLDAGR